MAKYRKRPVVIEAVQWTGENLLEILQFSEDSFIDRDDYTLKIETLEGVMTVSRGDYIVKGVDGEFYPCKPDIFEKTMTRYCNSNTRGRVRWLLSLMRKR